MLKALAKHYVFCHTGDSEVFYKVAAVVPMLQQTQAEAQQDTGRQRAPSTSSPATAGAAAAVQECRSSSSSTSNTSSTTSKDGCKAEGSSNSRRPATSVYGYDLSFLDADTAFMIFYSIIILCTDMRSPAIKHRMTKEDFIQHNLRVPGLSSLPAALWAGTYDELALQGLPFNDAVPVGPAAHALREGVAQRTPAPEAVAVLRPILRPSSPVEVFAEALTQQAEAAVRSTAEKVTEQAGAAFAWLKRKASSALAVAAAAAAAQSASLAEGSGSDGRGADSDSAVAATRAAGGAGAGSVNPRAAGRAVTVEEQGEERDSSPAGQSSTVSSDSSRSDEGAMDTGSTSSTLSASARSSSAGLHTGSTRRLQNDNTQGESQSAAASESTRSRSRSSSPVSISVSPSQSFFEGITAAAADGTHAGAEAPVAGPQNGQENGGAAAASPPLSSGPSASSGRLQQQQQQQQNVRVQEAGVKLASALQAFGSSLGSNTSRVAASWKQNVTPKLQQLTYAASQSLKSGLQAPAASSTAAQAAAETGQRPAVATAVVGASMQE